MLGCSVVYIPTNGLFSFVHTLLLLLFSCSVLSYSLQHHGLQHAWFLCPSVSPGACSNSCPLSRWCYITISSSVSPSPFAFIHFQHQGLFQWVSSSPGVNSDKESAFNAGEVRGMGSTSGSAKSPGRGHGNPLHLFVPGESLGQRILVGNSP